ncbi:hypothetical protein M407DRAFT_10628 [Tulasnella calospora MUT 4182]|uniref:Uncharacterized protein n=1 Tax=Tulasnella calospora MUT 4182 TaxID=1051891 RepID=A0A0C3PZL7_9AGAM|nr:hypothetical protein M407DRAFT_10628 [Tulasnella calospora MUT 4182]
MFIINPFTQGETPIAHASDDGIRAEESGGTSILADYDSSNTSGNCAIMVAVGGKRVTPFKGRNSRKRQRRPKVVQSLLSGKEFPHKRSAGFFSDWRLQRGILGANDCCSVEANAQLTEADPPKLQAPNITILLITQL